MCWLEQWDLIPLIYDHPLKSIFDSLKRACFLLKINYLIEEGIACPMTSKRRRRNLLDLLAPIAWPQPWTTCTEAFPSWRADRPSLVKSLLPLKHPFRQRRTEQAHLLLWLGVDWEKKVAAKGKL